MWQFCFPWKWRYSVDPTEIINPSIHSLYLFNSAWGQESNRWLVCNMVYIWVIHTFRQKGKLELSDNLMYMFLDSWWILGEKIWSNIMRAWEIFGAASILLVALCFLFVSQNGKINKYKCKKILAHICVSVIAW